MFVSPTPETAAPSAASGPSGPSLHAGYQPLPGVYDELMTPEGTLRPHWQRFIAGLDAMPEGEFARRRDQAQRLILQNGITYNVYADPRGMDRPWQLDILPVVIPAEEWRQVEAGLIQRARLLNAMLADLYGPQKLLRDGLLPAPLVFGNPQFLRPCHGIPAPGGVYLHLYAVDLGRGPDGRWWVLSDRTQAPSGAGYALENRTILTRVLSDLFRDCHVQRVADVFETVHDTLLALTRRDQPRIGLLTPGPFNETYFEHAYLARHLGYTLVEGGDLTVRDDKVYLKTLDGLKQVDLLLRRLDAEYCDPLELRSDSSLGVTGLVQAVKAGNVVMANAMGSGLVECNALMGFVPGLCRHLLGEELRIPCIATWWCGQAAARDYVLAHLDRMLIDHTFATRPMLPPAVTPVLGSDLSAERKHALAERMALRGYDFVGQELVALSTTPVWSEGRLRPKPVALRVFLAATGDGSYVVMPGGLTRVSASDDARAVSMQRGAGSKDTWVLADGPVGPMAVLRLTEPPVQLTRGGKDLPSRAADNLFWLGRYAERAEGTMRLLRSLLTRLTADGSPTGDDMAALERLAAVLVQRGQVAPRAAVKAAAGDTTALERDLARLLCAPDSPNGLLRVLGDLHRTAFLVRDRLSIDAWRTLNELQPAALAPAAGKEPRLEIGRALDRLNDMIRTMAAFSGMEMENMTRSHGWRVLDLGRRLERAVHMIDLLCALTVAGDPERDGRLDLLLELADSFMTYRSRYVTTPKLAPVLDLLLVDESNPRSVGFQIAVLEDHIDRLPRGSDPSMLSGEQRIVTAARTELRLADVAVLCQTDDGGRRGALEALLNELGAALPELSDQIGRSYFSHAELGAPTADGRRGVGR